MAQEESAQPDDAQTQDPEPKALLFELEYIAAEGRQAEYEAVKNWLSPLGVKLTPVLFSRRCPGNAPAQYARQLLETAGKPSDIKASAAAELASAIDKSTARAADDMRPGLQALLDAARDKSMRLGALSTRGQATAGLIMEQLGLARLEVAMEVFAGNDGADAADAWHSLARAVATGPTCCVAVVSGGQSCRAALAAGMKCVVIPDAFTSFQDFGGADLVIDKLDDVAPSDVLGLLERAT